MQPASGIVGEALVVACDGSLVNDFADTHHMGEKSRPHGFQRHKPPGPGNFCNLRGFSGVDVERFLYQQVLSGIQGEHRVGMMERVRGGDIDGVDVRVLDESLVAAMCRGNVEPLGECLARCEGTDPTACTVRSFSTRSFVCRIAMRPGPRIPQWS